jgi:hypothetical protein
MPNEWIKFVKKVWEELKKENPNASYKEALKEASKRKKRKDIPKKQRKLASQGESIVAFKKYYLKKFKKQCKEKPFDKALKEYVKKHRRERHGKGRKRRKSRTRRRKSRRNSSKRRYY